MLDIQSPEVFRTILESLKMGVCLVDHDRKIVFWNRGAEEITGYLQQEVLGRFCRELLAVKFHERNRMICERACPVLAAIRDGQLREGPAYLHHKAGYPVPVSIRAIPVRDPQGHVVGAAETFLPRSVGPRPQRPESDLAVGHGLDNVTRLPDHHYTEWYLLDHLQFASLHGMPFGLLAIRIEQLDRLMARYGLKAEEAMLDVVAHTLNNGLDAPDFVGCWSRNMFLAIIASGDEATLLATGKRLKRLAGSSEITWWGDPLSVVVSVGGVIVAPGETFPTLMARLEGALQQYPLAGGDSVSGLGADEQE